MPRVYKSRVAGISPTSTAPFWRGETAETLSATRVLAKQREQEAKRLARAEARAAKRSVKGERSTDARTTSRTTSRERSPNANLRRLERALARRKTLVARQRLSAQIDALRQKLGLS